MVGEHTVPGAVVDSTWIDVCVCTYKRPTLLAGLLDSLLGQETRQAFGFGIVVVDNDADGSAAGIVRDRSNSGMRLIYDVEPVQNISLARNRALGHAVGDYVAIIDDDERASALWLYHLHRTMQAHRADVVFGPVLRCFESTPPRSVAECGAFDMPDPPTGSADGFSWAGNALLRRSILQGRSQPFDPAFGRTGGGDSNLYLELKRSGHRLVWCSEARVHEVVPPERAKWSWILKRDFRVGNNTDRFGHRPRPTLSHLARAFFRPLGKACRGLLPDRTKTTGVSALSHLRQSAWALGRIAHRLGYQHKEYSGSS